MGVIDGPPRLVYKTWHINYDITHGHLEVWTQEENTTDTNSDSRDDKTRKAKEDT